MQDFLIHTLGYSPRAAEDFIAAGGTSTTIKNWTRDTCPSATRWALLNARREELHKLIVSEPLIPWATKWKVRDFVRRASIRELRWTMDENPYYPCFAYGVSYEACSDLSLPCSDAKRAHAMVCDQIRRGQSVTPTEGEDLTKVVPIDLSSHPLKGTDLDATPRAELLRLGGLNGAGEVRRATNDLRIQNGVYVRKQASKKALAKFIMDMLKD